MALAWSQEWLEAQMKLCRDDPIFQEEAAPLNRSFTVCVRADPDHGVAEDTWWGVHIPTMEKAFWGEENTWDTDYALEGSYRVWHAVNEGKKGLVAVLLDQSMLLRRGSTSYLAMFVPAIERFLEISRSITDTYAGSYELVTPRS